MPSLRHVCNLLVFRWCTLLFEVLKSLRSAIPEFLLPESPELPLFEIPRENTLAGLLPELLLSIADSLPRDDVTCLSLCSHRLFSLFHDRCHPVLHTQKLSILKRLERDLPNYFICHICYLLHEFDGSEDFGLSGSIFELACPLPCSSEWKRYGLLRLTVHLQGFTILYCFCFLHLQLAMRRFYYGPQSGISTEAICFTQVQHFEKSTSPGISSLFSLDAQICCEPPGLFLRIQMITSVPSNEIYLLYTEPNGGERWHDPLKNVWICRHVPHEKLTSLIDKVMMSRYTGKRDPSAAYTCYRCSTDCYIEIHEQGSDLLLVVTKWVNLGAGLTPDDLQWKVHSSALDAYKMEVDPTNMKASSRACFEDTSLRPLEALRCRNFSYLKDK